MSFNPAAIAEKRETQWSERKIEEKYREQKKTLYSKLRAFYGLPADKRNKADIADILADIAEFNKRVISRKLHLKGISPITSKSIKTNMRISFRPSKRERLRTANE